jgi:hypothetical protein
MLRMQIRRLVILMPALKADERMDQHDRNAQAKNWQWTHARLVRRFGFDDKETRSYSGRRALPLNANASKAPCMSLESTTLRSQLSSVVFSSSSETVPQRVGVPQGLDETYV